MTASFLLNNSKFGKEYGLKSANDNYAGGVKDPPILL